MTDRTARTGGEDPSVRLRTYQNHSLDSTRWKEFVPRHDDVIVVSSYKSGTTWVQIILLRLFSGGNVSDVAPELSPLEAPFEPVSKVLGRIERQCDRRVIKTHLPLDGLSYDGSVKYIVVCRDARDVFMSLWNHYRNLVRYPFLAAPTHPLRHGGPLPKPPADIREFWRHWMTRGWFDWEREGYPFWANLRHTQTWWRVRTAANVLFVHFNDLLRDPSQEIQRIADFVNVSANRARIRELAEGTAFGKMRSEGDRLLPAARRVFREGAQTFFYRGTNGRWRDVLNTDDLLLYATVSRAELAEGCRAWLESGRCAGEPAHLA